MCPDDDKRRDTALAVYDLFADMDLEQMVPEAANLLKGTVACGVVGNIWNANLSFLSIPGQPGPCGFTNYHGLAAGYSDNCVSGGGSSSASQFTSNPWADEYVFWTNFISVYAGVSNAGVQSPD